MIATSPSASAYERLISSASRKSGSYPGYNYSDANKNSGLIWDEATLQEYLKNPKAKVPGTKMLFPGLKRDDDIVNVIAFLKQYGSETK